MYKYMLIVLSALGFSSAANAACDKNLYGNWTAIGKNYEAGQEIKGLPFKMTWNFNKNGKATINMAPILQATDNYKCEGKKVTILKTVPTTLNIIKLNKSELVYQEEGDIYYFYFKR